jgi:hypothetical protein
MPAKKCGHSALDLLVTSGFVERMARGHIKKLKRHIVDMEIKTRPHANGNVYRENDLKGREGNAS